MATERRLVVYGAGGHGKVIAEMSVKAGFAFVGFADELVSLHGTRVSGWPVFGGLEWLYGLPRRLYSVALGIGNNYIRMALAKSLVSHDIELATIVSSAAIAASSARIGRGAVIMPCAVVNPDAVIGEGAILNTGAVVEHDVSIGQYAHVSPNAAIGGGAEVGDLTHIGMGATVLPLVRIGSHSIVGAGSTVVRNIGQGVVAFGSPARVRRGCQPDGRLPISLERSRA